MVKRSIKEAIQRVAARRVLEVSCEPAGLAAAVQGLLENWNAAADAAFEASLATKGGFQRWLSRNRAPLTRHYFSLARQDQVWVTFGTRATFVAERGFNPKGGGWLAEITPGKSGTDGTMRMTVMLAKWAVNDGGLIWNGTRYVQLLDGLVAGLGGRYIDAPVDEEDHRFVSYA